RLMIPERLEQRTQQCADDRQRKNDRATEDRDREFKRRVQLQRTCPQFRRRRDRGPERETGHEAGKDQRRRPDRITEGEAAQPQPERFKNQRADSRKKKNNRKNRESHGSDNTVTGDGVTLIPRSREAIGFGAWLDATACQTDALLAELCCNQRGGNSA